MDHVVLVDEHDAEIGTMEKMEAHRKGILHRAFSIIIFNSAGDMLLQKRSPAKYHGGGLWSNACCSHPLPGEPVELAAQRRLKEELGIETELSFSNKFVYRAQMENDLIEHEMDYVFVGYHEGPVFADKNEIEDWRYMPLSDIIQTINETPQQFTPWFKLIMEQPELLPAQ